MTRTFCHLSLLWISFLTGSWAVPELARGAPAAELEHPRDFHHRLRQRAALGHNTADAVREWQAKRNDHSFDSFLLDHSHLRRETQMLLQAISLEAKRQEREAAQLYRKGAVLFRQQGALSEAAFSLYYASELAQSEGDPGASLALLDQAWSLRSPVQPQPFLTATLLQGRGYTLWYLDQLQPSIQAFQQSLERFRQLGVSEGIAATWNNLAILHEELLLPERARLSYQKALSLDENEFSAPVAFQLNANVAFFLARFGHPGEYVPYLERARQLRHQDPFEFALLECRVGEHTSCPKLRASKPKHPARQIERLLALGRAGADYQTGLDYFRRARVLAQSISSPFWERKAILELGELLETHELFEEAARLYRKGWEKERDQFQQQAVYYPFSRAIAPLFSGRIRSLVGSGHSGQAWIEIQEFSRRRQARIEGLKSLPDRPTSARTEHDFALQAATRGVEKPLRVQPLEATRFPSPKGFSILELWSEGSDLFIWVFARDRHAFRRCSLPGSIAQLVDSAVGPFYQADRLLPGRETVAFLRPLYELCFRPLEAWFEPGRLLVIAHNEIQSLPLDILPDGTGFLGNRIAFSYLPRWREPSPPASFPDRPQLLLSGMAQASDAEWLGSLFPNMQVVQQLPTAAGSLVRLPWLHISTHSRLRPENWLASSMGGKQQIEIEELMEANFHSRLLTLGMCDGGKNVMGTNPYWLGLAEVLLERRTDSILLSHWKLDEFSLGIYQGVYRRLRAGQSLDLALFHARQDFRKTVLIRSGSRQSADHPFFWGGISYLGHPDLKFSATSRSDYLVLELVIVIWAIVMMLLWRILGRGYAGPVRGGNRVQNSGLQDSLK